jgi:hypothetical protein
MPAHRQDIEALREEAASLAAEAARLGESYRRSTWVRFVGVFFPVPFVVLLLRLELEPWHYYVAGAAYLLFSAGLYSFDTAASTKCDEAERAAGRARQAYEIALHLAQRATD